MGRTKLRAKRGRNAPGVRAELKSQSIDHDSPSKSKSTPGSEPPTVPKLLEKAQEFLTRCEYELASKFVERILELDPGNLEAMEMRGVVRVEMGDVEGAREAFTALLNSYSSSSASSTLSASQNQSHSRDGNHSSTPNPNPNPNPPPSAHLYLAQLSDDPRESIEHYQAAVDLLVNAIKGKERATPTTDIDAVNSSTNTNTNTNLSTHTLINSNTNSNVKGEQDDKEEDESRRTAIRALVSMVEIYMSDLCFEPEAEAQCERYLGIALQLDPNSPEVLQSLASVRISQSRPEEAKELVGRAWGFWRETVEDDGRSASPAVLLSLTRIFLELALYEGALEILQVVFAQDDEEVEAWYLQGWCFVLMAEQVKEGGLKLEELGWRELAQDARDCLETCRGLHGVQEHGDGALLEHVEELIAELEKAGVQPSPPDVGEEGGAEEEEEDVWTDEEGGEDIEMGS